MAKILSQEEAQICNWVINTLAGTANRLNSMFGKEFVNCVKASQEKNGAINVVRVIDRQAVAYERFENQAAFVAAYAL